MEGTVRATPLMWIFLAPSICVAQPVDQGGSYGLGIRSCAEFAKFYAQSPSNTEDAFFSWAQGFISGLNLSSEAATNTARRIEGSIPSQRTFVRDYCDSHPLQPYYMAALALYKTFAPVRISK
jgi:hypothetical protein